MIDLKELLNKTINNKLLYISFLAFASYAYDYFYLFGLTGLRTFIKHVYLLWGIYLVLYMLIKEKLCKDKQILAGLGFVGICVISLLVNVVNKYNIANTLLVLFYLVILFGTMKTIKKEDARSFITKGMKIIIILSFIITMGSFIALLTKQINFRGWPHYGRYSGIYDEPGEAGASALMSIVFSLFMLDNKADRKYKVFLWFNIAIQLLIQYFSDSRTSWLCLILVLLVSSYYYLKNIRNSKFVLPKAVLFTCAMIVGLQFATKPLITWAQGYANAPMPEVIDRDFDASDVIGALDGGTEDLYGEQHSKLYILLDNGSSGRLSIWSSAIDVWKESPIIGKGYKNGGISYVLWEGLSMSHNLIFNLLPMTGIVGTVYFVVYLIWVLLPLLKIKDIAKNHDIFLWTFIGTVLIHSMLEYGIICDFAIITLLFWLVVGYFNNNQSEIN